MAEAEENVPLDPKSNPAAATAIRFNVQFVSLVVHASPNNQPANRIDEMRMHQDQRRL